MLFWKDSWKDRLKLSHNHLSQGLPQVPTCEEMTLPLGLGLTRLRDYFEHLLVEGEDSFTFVNLVNDW